MGFNSSDILSDESHYSEFLCVFCRDLADDAHVLECSHVFCRHCLQHWIDRARKRAEVSGVVTEPPTCPSCRTQCSGEMRPLCDANPLAARILGRVRCRCPLHAQGCDWRGDYADVHNHLTNSTAHDVSKAPQQNAEALKAQADSKYAEGAYDRAFALYTKAIELAPRVASYWGNRAACSFMVRNYVRCVEDCDAALGLDSSMSKAAKRRSRALVELSKFDEAKSGLTIAISHFRDDQKHHRILSEELKAISALDDEIFSGASLMRAGDFKGAVASFGRALQVTTAVVVVLGAAVAELGNGRLDRALRLTMQVLTRPDAANFKAPACVVRGAVLVLQDDGDIENGLALLREALRLDPDDHDAKNTFKAAKTYRKDRLAASQLMLKRDFQSAVDAYTAILVDQLGGDDDRRGDLPAMPASSRLALPSFSSLARTTPAVAQVRAERANCYLRLGEHQKCIRDCAFALYVKDDCIDAHLTRASALRALGRHDDALSELGALMERWGHQDVRVRHAYETTEFESRKSKRPDYYAILGCRSISTDKEIKAAYYQRSKEHHPDRHVNDDNKTKADHEQAFKLVGEALEILDDHNKRKLYDQGYDKAAIEERIAAAERASREHSYHKHNHRHHHH